MLRFHAEPGNATVFKLTNPASLSSSSDDDDDDYTPSSSSSSSTPSVEDNLSDANEVSATVDAANVPADIPESDRITSIVINPAFNMKNKNGSNVELDLSKITIKANEIYDEESLKRAEAALGTTISGNKHYNLLDLTLLYNGADFSNGYDGLVKVVVPLPTGHRDKDFSCYRLTEVNGQMVKQTIPGTQTGDSYIIYLEHFSLYALVADANPDPNPGTGKSGVGALTGLAVVSAATLIVCRRNKRK